MQSILHDGLFNPYRRRYISENKRTVDLPHAMEDHVKNYLKSGLTQIEYCRVNRLSYSKLVYWLRKNRNQVIQIQEKNEPVLYKLEEPQYRYEDLETMHAISQ